MIVIIKVIYKMIPYVIFQLCFNGDDWKVDVNNRKDIPQTWKTMEIRDPVWATGVKVVFKFVMSRGSGVSFREFNVVDNVEVSCGRRKWFDDKQNILDIKDVY